MGEEGSPRKRAFSCLATSGRDDRSSGKDGFPFLMVATERFSVLGWLHGRKAADGARPMTRPSPTPRDVFRSARSLYRRSTNPRYADVERPERLTRSGVNGSWHPPVNRDWSTCVQVLSRAGMIEVANWLRFPSPAPAPRPLGRLACAESRLACDREQARMLALADGCVASMDAARLAMRRAAA